MLKQPPGSVGDFLVRQSPSRSSFFCMHVRDTAEGGSSSFPIDERDGMFSIRSNKDKPDPHIQEAFDLKFKTLPALVKAFMHGGAFLSLLFLAFILRVYARE
jgi:hypothetical protein